MRAKNIGVAQARVAQLLAGVFSACGREDLRAVAPDECAGEPVLLVAHCAALLAHAGRYRRVLAPYALRQQALQTGTAALTTYSLDSDAADYTARNLRRTPEGFIAFEIVGVGCIGRIRLQGRLPVPPGAPLLPREEQEDILAAVAAAVSCGVSFADALDAMQALCRAPS